MSTPSPPSLNRLAWAASTSMTATARTPSSAGCRTGRLVSVASATIGSASAMRFHERIVNRHSLLPPGRPAEAGDDPCANLRLAEFIAPFERVEDAGGHCRGIVRLDQHAILRAHEFLGAAAARDDQRRAAGQSLRCDRAEGLAPFAR